MIRHAKIALCVLLLPFLVGAGLELDNSKGSITFDLGKFAGLDLYDTNAIINPDGLVAQRGTSFAAIATDAYSLDRWAYTKSGAMVHTVSQSLRSDAAANAPTVLQAGRVVPSSILVDCTTVDSSIAAGDFIAIRQAVEGYRWLRVAERAFTLSFWVKGTKTGVHSVSIRNASVDRSYVAEYTINASDTWEFKNITVSAVPTGTWNYSTGVGAYITWALAAGSTYQTTAGAWQTGNFIATANQVNAADSTSNDFRICGVQLESGSTATPFRARSFDDENFKCRRYYQKYEYSTQTLLTQFFSGSSGLGDHANSYTLDVQMRALPSAQLTGTWDKGNLSLGPSVIATSKQNFYLSTRYTAANTNTYFQMNSSDDSLTFDAEL